MGCVEGCGCVSASEGGCGEPRGASLPLPAENGSWRELEEGWERTCRACWAVGRRLEHWSGEARLEKEQAGEGTETHGCIHEDFIGGGSNTVGVAQP